MADAAPDLVADVQPVGSLAWLIAPEPAERFLAEHWERQPLVVHRGMPDRHAGLLSLDDVHRVLTETVLRLEDVQVTNAARDVRPEQYSREGGIIDVARLYQELADGSTVILPQLHLRLPRLAAFCRSLESELGARFQTNVYLTPAGARGFRSHYDSHDVFVLQVAGRKRWRLYQTPIRLPMQGQRFTPGSVEPERTSAAFTLEPGDTAYIPRGVMHDAESDDGPSLHITVGMLTRTWHDLFVEALSEVTLNDPDFRRSLPPGFVGPGYDRSAARARFRELMDRLVARADFDAALDRFVDDLAATRHPLLPGQSAQMAALPRLDGDSLVAARPGLICRLEQKANTLTIHCYGNAVIVPAKAAPAAVAALQSSGTAIRDLPGPLDLEGRLVLVRRLVREGLVTVQVP
jgi:ribosomal protein L16 Arg81 hydroxylase